MEFRLLGQGQTTFAGAGRSSVKDRVSPEATAAAFDEEGYYRTGDAARFADPECQEIGLEYDGRISENFKLQSGTWTEVGNMRLAFLDALYPLLQDAVIVDETRSDVRAMGWLRLADAQALARGSGTIADLAAHPRTVIHVSAALARYNAAAGGQSRRVAALRILFAPPSGDESADKGYINQREVQCQQPDHVAALCRDEAILPT